MADDDRAARHRARVRHPFHEPGICGDREWPGERPPIPRCEHADRLVRQAEHRRAQQPVLGILSGRRRDQDEGLVAGRRLHVRVRRLPDQRADNVLVRPPRARVLELRKRADDAQPLADPPVEPLQGRQPEPPAGLVQLIAPLPQSARHRPPQSAPQGCAGNRPRRPRADRVRSEARTDTWVGVGDQGRGRDPLEFGGERGREREDVVDDDVRTSLAQRVPRHGRRLDDRLVRLERALARREHRVLGGGEEPHAGVVHVRAPALPRLDRDVVAALAQAGPEREDRERMPGVAERPEEDLQRGPRGAQ